VEVTSAARNCEMKRYSVVRPTPSSAVAALTAAGSRLVPPVAKRVRMTSARRLARAQASSPASASAPLLATNLPPTLHDSQSRISCSPATARSEYRAVSPAFPSSFLTDLPRVSRPGILYNATYRAPPGPNRKQIEEPPPDDWHLGVLPPDVAAPVLMARVTFLAGDSEDLLAGLTWDSRILADGEERSINTETLLWHLTAGEGQKLRKMFALPLIQVFLPSLTILADGPIALPARPEAKRRRWTLWGRGGWTRANSPPSGWRRGWEAAYRPSSPYALNRFTPVTVPVEPSATSKQTHHRAAAAVYKALETDPTDNGEGPSKYDGTLFGNRYIHFWLLRHLHLHPDQLTEILAKAVDLSQATDRGIILPEIPLQRQTTKA
jgi:hypothetical protein